MVGVRQAGSSRSHGAISAARSPSAIGIVIGTTRRPSLRAEIVQQRLAARADPVDLVDEHEQRQTGRAHRLHEATRLRLHAFHRRNDQHDAVEHPQRALDLGDEIGVAGGIDQVDLAVAELEGDDRGLDRDPAGALQLQRVGLRRAFVDAADRADDAGFEEDAFGETWFSRRLHAPKFRY